MTLYFGFFMELLVAILLIVTIFYCATLERRLVNMRLNEAEMRKTIHDLSEAAERAERAIEKLAGSVKDCEDIIGSRLKVAEVQANRLDEQVRVGADVLTRISHIVDVARGSRIAS